MKKMRKKTKIIVVIVIAVLAVASFLVPIRRELDEDYCGMPESDSMTVITLCMPGYRWVNIYGMTLFYERDS